MKDTNLILTLFLLFSFASCEKNPIEVLINMEDSTFHEEYTPIGCIKEVLNENGQSLFMDEDSVLFLGDMVFPSSCLDSNQTKLAIILPSSVYYWEGQSIPYHISKGFNSTAKSIIYKGIGMINAELISTQLVEVTNSSQASILFLPDPNGSSSPVGKQYKRNEIRIWNNPALQSGSVAHEIMHSLGYFHEQSRSDRDNYVMIHWDNIIPEFMHNFNKFENDGYNGFDQGVFDYYSIMNYGSWGFTIDSSKPTITKTDGITTFGSQRYYLTNSDKESLAFIYGPKPFLTSDIRGHDIADDGVTYRSRTDYTNSVKFKDRNGAYITLAYPRRFTCLYHTYDFNSQNPGTHFVYPVEIVIPAGTSTYYLSDTRCEYHEELGTIRYEHQEYYTY